MFQYELMFCIEEESDPAIMIVKKLIEKYPNVDSKIFIGKFKFYIHILNLKRDHFPSTSLINVLSL